jgi:hypothetical protein
MKSSCFKYHTLPLSTRKVWCTFIKLSSSYICEDTHVFKLQANPASSASIYAGGYVAQMEYLSGIEERDAINFAYRYSQEYGYIVATAILVSAVPVLVCGGHYRVDKEQNKGTVL